MNKKDCFSELKTKGKELIPYLEYLTTFDKLPWQEHYGFNAIQIDNKWINKEPALKEVHKIHPIKQLGLLKIPKKSFYNWHVDDFRQSCINLLVSKELNSYSMFGEHDGNYYHNNIIQLSYKPNTYYLFNNQNNHCVLNLNETDRYLFSLYFYKEIPYSVIKKNFMVNSIIEK